MTAQNRNAVYACINLGETGAPADIRRRSICTDADIGKAIKHMLIFSPVMNVFMKIQAPLFTRLGIMGRRIR